MAMGLGLLVAAAGASLDRVAAETRGAATVDRVPAPKPPRGRGEKCVAETDWMRRNHPSALTHQRDSTVHDGIRTQRFSLKGCIDCHAVTGADGQPVTSASPQHFCRTCHDYVAVRVDCFECHASRPVAASPTGAAAPNALESAETAALGDYVRSLGK